MVAIALALAALAAPLATASAPGDAETPMLRRGLKFGFSEAEETMAPSVAVCDEPEMAQGLVDQTCAEACAYTYGDGYTCVDGNRVDEVVSGTWETVSSTSAGLCSDPPSEGHHLFCYDACCDSS